MLTTISRFILKIHEPRRDARNDGDQRRGCPAARVRCAPALPFRAGRNGLALLSTKICGDLFWVSCPGAFDSNMGAWCPCSSNQPLSGTSSAVGCHLHAERKQLLTVLILATSPCMKRWECILFFVIVEMPSHQPLMLWPSPSSCRRIGVQRWRSSSGKRL